ncbi:uncharacterized protein LOC127862523 [Dreissena polymorpha]|uniref:uncharacterized protein LOC127862523 n=1 Tax=Dreissena polymorpha TaxID=45954 RepID=UPI002264EA7B|nr:uncharacterized protein LOC127862523 [Dreissena polymorpha]
MVKSRAEICKDYRKRLKEKDNEGYLRKERERRRSNYIPTGLLSSAEKTERRKNIRESVKRYREKKKRLTEEQNVSSHNESINTSGYESVNGAIDTSNNMIVAMQFPRRAAGPTKRVTRELKRAKKEITELKRANIDLARKLKTEQRKRQRFMKRFQSSPQTPRSSAEKLMNRAGLTPAQKDKVRKEIIFGNVLSAQLRSKMEEHTKASINQLHRIVAGKIIRKYRFSSMLSKKTGLNKNTISKYTNYSQPNQTKGRRVTRKYEKLIIEFFERDDNSRISPGKADCVNTDGGAKQSRVLTDYLQNLHEKFLSKNPECKVSFATFCRIRPRNIKLSAFISRNSCLCTKHQNMSLTAKTLKREGVSVSVNPDVFAKDEIDRQTVLDSLNEVVTVPQWKRVVVDDRGKQKSVMRITDTKMGKQEFFDHIENQKQDFSEHAARVKNQYLQMRTLKQNLPQKQVVIQMDFAENYACRSSDEIQSAYFNQTGVTLHPVVIYYMQNNELKHKSIVIVSDTLAHNAHTVVTFLDTIQKEVKQMIPDIEVCHFWTDSPTSQYRNKLIFDVVANYDTIFGCQAVWNYFEAGHGKGPCDGLGGTVKRLADNAIKTGKVMIQDASGFYSWAKETSSFHNVEFKFVTDKEISDKTIVIAKYAANLRPVKGTMKLHAVVGQGNFKIFVRDTSCYCVGCLSGVRCDDWRAEHTRKPTPTAAVTVHADILNEIEVSVHIASESVIADGDLEAPAPSASIGLIEEGQPELEPLIVTETSANIGEYVAAVYENQ